MDPNTKPWVARSLRTSLGIIAHALTEETARGNAPPPAQRRAWLTEHWDRLVEKEVRLLRAAWPGRAIPEPKTWPGYVATRTRLLRRLESEESMPVADRMSQWSADGARGRRLRGHLPPLPWVELRLGDADARLYGTPDRVEVREGRLRVVDLKTGVHQGGIQPAQLRQLLLYAHLVKTAAGVLPHEVVLQNVKGQEAVITVDPEAVAAVVAQAKEAIRAFNSMQASAVFAAAPSQENCGTCPFRIVCSPYWSARTQEWTGRDIRGVITKVDGGSAAILLTNPNDASQGFRLLSTAGVQLVAGEEIVALDLERAGPATGRMQWNSRYRRPPLASHQDV